MRRKKKEKGKKKRKKERERKGADSVIASPQVNTGGQVCSSGPKGRGMTHTLTTSALLQPDLSGGSPDLARHCAGAACWPGLKPCPKPCPKLCSQFNSTPWPCFTHHYWHCHGELIWGGVLEKDLCREEQCCDCMGSFACEFLLFSERPTSRAKLNTFQ